MLTKIVEFCKTHMRYLTKVLFMYAIVMSFGIFGNVGMGLGTVLSFACAATKEIYGMRHGEKTSIFNVAAYMIGIIAGLLMSGFGVIIA